MRIVAIIENESGGRLKNEKGLALVVETGDFYFLVDTGASSLVIENLKKTGYDPREIENVVISHNHSDHIGGLSAFFKVNKKARAYVSSAVVGEFVRYRQGHLDVLSNNYEMFTVPERFIGVDDITDIVKGVSVCRIKSPQSEYMCRDFALKKIVDTEMLPDDFKHEVYVVVKEDDGYKIISPCSHNGILNIIADAKARFGVAPTAFVGGLHLAGTECSYVSDDDVRELAVKLNGTGLQSLYTCHCTGRRAYEILKENCSFPVNYFSAGQSFKV